MPRKRMLDPSFWQDEKIGQCSFMERLLFEGLWTFADDNGVGRASPLLLKAVIFPYDTLREADIEKSLVKLASLMLIVLYEINQQKYYFVTNFKKHQTINKPTPSDLPLPLPEHYGSTPVGLPPEEKRKEEKGKEENSGRASRFAPPTLDEVRDYCQERKNGIDPQRFVDYYSANGWVQGKGKPIKDWKAAVRTWEGKNGTASNNNGASKSPGRWGNLGGTSL